MAVSRTCAMYLILQSIINLSQHNVNETKIAQQYDELYPVTVIKIRGQP